MISVTLIFTCVLGKSHYIHESHIPYICIFCITLYVSVDKVSLAHKARSLHNNSTMCLTAAYNVAIAAHAGKIKKQSAIQCGSNHASVSIEVKPASI